MPAHHLPHHDRTPRLRSLMDDCVGRMEDPVVSVATLKAHTRLVRGDDGGTAQRRDGLLAAGTEARWRPTEQVHQTALAEPQTEQVGQRRLQPLVGERLESLQIRCHRMQSWAERCAPRRLRHRRYDPRPTGRAVHS